MGLDKLRNLLAHKRVEVRVEPVDGAVDPDGHPRLLHLVDEGGDARGDQVRRAPRYAFAHVPHARHVGFRRVRETCNLRRKNN